jgi:hypothetical protein
MNKEINKILTNLKIISKITEYNKFYINTDNYIIVEKNSLLVSIYRYIYNIDRYKNINDLIIIYDEVFLYINNIINNNIYDDDNIKQLKDLSTALKNSIIGLSNLKIIYSLCIIIDSKLDIIENNINNYIIKINHIIDN